MNRRHLVLLCFLVACGAQDNDESVFKQVIDHDSRTIANEQSPLGKVLSRGSCTGFAISPNEVMTAAHCFDPEFKGLFIFNEHAYRIEDAREWLPNADIAVLKVFPELPDHFRLSLSHHETLRSEPSKNIRVLSQSTTSTQTVSPGKIYQILDQDQNPLTGFIAHDSDTEPGASGSPILNEDGDVIGVHLGSLQDQALNYGVLIKERHDANLQGNIFQHEGWFIPVVVGAARICIQNPNCISTAIVTTGAVVGWTANKLYDYYTLVKKQEFEIQKMERQLGIDMARETYLAALKMKDGKNQQKVELTFKKAPPGYKVVEGKLIYAGPEAGSSNKLPGGSTGNGQLVWYDCSFQDMKCSDSHCTVTLKGQSCQVAIESVWDDKVFSNEEFLGAYLGGSVYAAIEEVWTEWPIPWGDQELFHDSFRFISSQPQSILDNKSRIQAWARRKNQLIHDARQKEKEQKQKQKWKNKNQGGCSYCEEL